MGVRFFGQWGEPLKVRCGCFWLVRLPIRPAFLVYRIALVTRWKPDPNQNFGEPQRRVYGKAEDAKGPVCAGLLFAIAKIALK